MHPLPNSTQKQIGEIVGEWRQHRPSLTGDGIFALLNNSTPALASALRPVLAPAKIEHWSYLAAADGATGNLPGSDAAPEGCILFASKQRVETLGLVARLRAQLKPSGLLLFCCENALGAKGFQSRFREAFAIVKVHLAQSWRLMELAGSTPEGPALFAEWLEQSSDQLIPGTSFHTIPGIYGWNKIDVGSELLIASLSKPLQGRGLDLGCGYGYLSHQVLTRFPGITGLTLLDHDWRSVACARRNLESFPVAKEFLWSDVRSFRPQPDHDWAILNPPFHSGQQVDMTLGREFIAQAAAALKAQGTLDLVANSFLPYGDLLRSLFRQVEKVRMENGFTVYHAAQPIRGT